ncbi:E3 SUMO-protein ligase ZBED1-like [Mya arenaria]|uniref:E3 SUMO-protein ligase ZBED1-like n=1 Tax=Mya arenaria TaxID=6604 RepID=UPI0022E4718E|nr:E3 SUMO-protein ligase ZBED1-like [Mya arenaria]
MPPKVTSSVWKYFTKTEDGKSVVCNLCSVKLVYCGGTSNLRNHMKKHPVCSPPSTPSKTPLKQTTLDVTVSCAVTDWVVRDCLPLSVVDGQGFRDMMALAAPSYTVPTRPTVRARVEKRYADERSNLISRLEKATSVSLTTITWTSNSTESFITVTAHYLDAEWILHSDVLMTRAMPERHPAENIASRLQECVRGFGLTGKVECCVHDNACNIQKTSTLCPEWGDHSCFAHTLQLCIKPVLELPSVSKVLGKCRKLVGHFKHSTTVTAELHRRQERMQKEGEKQPTLALIQDVPKRWNSTQLMCNRLDKLRRSLTSCLTMTSRRRPTAISF